MTWGRCPRTVTLLIDLITSFIIAIKLCYLGSGHISCLIPKLLLRHCGKLIGHIRDIRKKNKRTCLSTRIYRVTEKPFIIYDSWQSLKPFMGSGENTSPELKTKCRNFSSIICSFSSMFRAYNNFHTFIPKFYYISFKVYLRQSLTLDAANVT